MPGRPVYLITGGTSSFKQRQRTIDEFEATKEGILVSTQMSLSSSVNVPSCDEVIVEALQWNQPKIFQYVFRAIRFDSLNKTNVRFFVYENSIEVNLLNLLVDKERINDFIKTKQVRSTEDVFSDFNLTMNFLEMLIEKTRDKEGKVQIKWGKQKFAA
jgi:SNF2 family DNA or RNA helicase